MKEIPANRETRLFAVTGNPVLHSKSPSLFEGGYPGTDDAYFRLAARSGEEAMHLFHELGLSGMNVTAPFKREIARLVALRSPEVDVLDAANTVVRERDGIRACNTDTAGVSGAIEAAGVVIEGKDCLVLGAGGAGCAAALALSRAGGRVTIVNRTIEKARAFARATGCACAGLDEQLRGRVERAGIVVNTLSPGVEVIEEGWLTPRHVILDAIYHGSYLQERAIRRRATYIDGARWLIHQGIPAYRLFTGAEPDAGGMERALATIPGIPVHVSFIGFMGTGKSTVARIVAGMSGMPVVDTDQVVERQSGKSIPQLIQEEGEARFRELELEVLRALLHGGSPSIISCGGGIVMHPEARRLLRARSIVVWLHAPPGRCVSRIDIASRPLLARHDRPAAAAATMFEERKALYARTAWLLVNSDGRAAKQVSEIVYDEICKCIRG